jgi:hypothetical protein
MKLTKKKLKISKRSKSRKKIKHLKKIKGGSIDEFINHIARNPEQIVKIGSGGNGIVYFDKMQRDVVFKVSKKSDKCRDWKKEKIIYDTLNRYNIDTRKCKLLKMINFRFIESNTDNKCYLELTRVVNPLGEDEDYTIQPLFGAMSSDKKYNETTSNSSHRRGYLLGITELIGKKFFPSEESIKEYIKDIAIVLARLHYIIKNDGFDIELFLDKKDDVVTIYIGDFDLTNFITEYTDVEKDRLLMCFEAIPYFPNPGQPELFEIFSKQYIKTALEAGPKAQAIAKEIISML